MIKANTNMTMFTWKSHESAGSLVEVENRGRSSAGLPAVFSLSCQTAPLTLGTEGKDDEQIQGKEPVMLVQYAKSMQHNKWGEQNYKLYQSHKALLTRISQVRNQSLHHNAKRVTIPWVSIFLWKHFKLFILWTRSFMSYLEAKKITDILWVISLPAPQEE